ncbi:MAG: glucosylglycerol 3-phosphatase [Cyanothece sp. SIO1E1]|nr:glucosylglycerol 3-phosphatase [Cyanothece sp. SIO1E1]
MSPHVLLHEDSLSLEHEKLACLLTNIENLIIIQDLDGVCMGLVKDPLTRVIDKHYVTATQAFDGHFYVLTNGEHIGQRGVNGIVERALGSPRYIKSKGFYLPGLAAGGVQWQDRYGNVCHPGVSEVELAFLETVPQRIQAQLQQFFQQHQAALASDEIEACIQASVLDNKASPTANLNTLYEKLSHQLPTYMALQQDMQKLMETLLQEAEAKGLGDSFFVHYAPNLGRDSQGQEIMRPAQAQDSGTTDFQFMVQGAIKEAGVLAILNHYYFQRTGAYPLGENFSVRQVPQSHEALLDLVQTHFDPAQMPVMVGVGDTVNSTVEEENGQLKVRRGGSDRNFLTLIQDIGQVFNKGNVVVYIDSSQGEVKNRRSVQISNGSDTQVPKVLAGPCDPRDEQDPLILNVVFPAGHKQYVDFFQEVAAVRGSQS